MHGSDSKGSRLAPLLAFLIPGAGHLALGMPVKGLMLLTGALLDIVAMIRYADDAGGKFALLLVLLGLGLPCFWFYSVFDTLQQRAKRQKAAGREPIRDEPAARAWLEGSVLVAAGLLLLILVRAPAALEPAVDTAGTWAPGAGLIALAALLAAKRRITMLKMGRITAATVIISVGGLLMWDQIRERNDIALLGQWWPAVFVLLGIEVIVYSLIFRSSGKRLTFDVAGGVLAAIIAVSAYSVTQYAGMPFRWLDEFNVGFPKLDNYGEEKGFQYVKEALEVPLDPSAYAINVDNPNGKVVVRKGDVASMRIESVVWVDMADKSAADEVAQQSGIEVTGTEKLKIVAKGQSYGDNGSRKPRINITITVPADSAFGQLPAVEDANNPAEGSAVGTDGVINIDANNASTGSTATSDTNSADGGGTATSNASSIDTGSTAASNANSADTGGIAASNAIGTDAGSTAASNAIGADADTEAASNANIAGTGAAAAVGTADAASASAVDPSEDAAAEATNSAPSSPQVPAGQTGDQPPAANESEAGGEAVQPELGIKVNSGSVEVSNLVLTGGLRIETVDGEIAVSDIAGDVDASTKNGSITAAGINGSAQLDTMNGVIKAQHIQGSIQGHTLSGNIALSGIAGDADVDTKNGEISISEAAAVVKADTLNGAITIRSSVVGGDWDLDSSIGEIRLFVPENGNYSVSGSVTFGQISTNLPLTESKKRLSGIIGAGTYRINIDANSSISVNRYVGN